MQLEAIEQKREKEEAKEAKRLKQAEGKKGEEWSVNLIFANQSIAVCLPFVFNDSISFAVWYD